MSIEETVGNFKHLNEIETVINDIEAANNQSSYAPQKGCMETAVIDGLLTHSVTAQRYLIDMYHGKITPVECLGKAFADAGIMGRPAWTSRSKSARVLIETAYSLAVHTGGAPCFENVTHGKSEYDTRYLCRALFGTGDTFLELLSYQYEDPEEINLFAILSTILSSWDNIYNNRFTYLAAMECCKLIGNAASTPESRNLVRRAFLESSSCWPDDGFSCILPGV